MENKMTGELKINDEKEKYIFFVKKNSKIDS